MTGAATIAMTTVACGQPPAPLIESTPVPPAPAVDAPMLDPVKAPVGSISADHRHGDARCLSDGWCWLHPQPSGETLHGVWGYGEDLLFAVGDEGVIQHFDGARWHIDDSGTDKQLNAVWGHGPAHVIAVGEEGVAVHFDGQSWTQKPTGVDHQLVSVWGSGPSDVFAVGEKAVLRFDGQAWETMETFDDWLTSVWARSPNDVYVTKYDASVHHYNGHRWAELVAPSEEDEAPHYMRLSDYLRRLRAIAGNDHEVLAVGTERDAYTQGYPQGRGLVLEAIKDTRWTGRSIVPNKPIQERDFYAAWMDTTGFAVAVGYAGRIAMRDGKTWSYTKKDSTAHLNAVWGSGPSNVYAVGQYGVTMHFDGDRWNTLLGDESPFNGVWCNNPSDVFAVGVHRILHFNGTDWKVAAETSKVLQAIWGHSSRDVFAVGWEGTILHYDGTEWRTQASGTTQDLSSVWGTAPDNVFAVGDEGTALHYDGKKWRSVPTRTQESLSAVWGLSSNLVFAVGSEGTVLRHGGASWLSQKVPTKLSLLAVAGSNPKDIHAVGSRGTIVHFDGGQWKRVAGTDRRPPPHSDLEPTISDITITESGQMFAVSDRLLRYEGGAWKDEPLPFRTSIRALATCKDASGQSVLMAVGNGGAVLKKPL